MWKRRVRASLSFLAFAICLRAEWRLTDTVRVDRAIRGAAVAADGSLYSWGHELRRWDGVHSTKLASFETADGGCLMGGDVIAPTADGLAYFPAPAYQRQIIDQGAVVWDCLATELLGHRGALVVHRGMQVRFYEPGTPKWTYREIYSFYTPSEQAGLLMRDVDQDGHPDIVCGNYWIQSPAKFDLPWRLFAINTLSNKPRSASARLASLGPKLVWAESREAPARLAIFTPQRDPQLIWDMEAVSSTLAYPQGLAIDGNDVLIAENNGAASRLFAGTRLIGKGWPTLLLQVRGDSLFQAGVLGIRRFDRGPRSSDTKGVVR